MLLMIITTLTDPRSFSQNRELEIMLTMHHINVTELRWYFYTVKEVSGKR